MANFGNFGNIIISKKKFGWDVVSVSTPNEDELIAIDNIKKLLNINVYCILNRIMVIFGISRHLY
jgi:hypothetical protein